MTDDWFDFIAALLDAEARFVVVGAHAMAVYGVVRGTQDLNLWIDPDEENASRVWEALDHFGALTDALGITTKDLTQGGRDSPSATARSDPPRPSEHRTDR